MDYWPLVVAWMYLAAVLVSLSWPRFMMNQRRKGMGSTVTFGYYSGMTCLIGCALYILITVGVLGVVDAQIWKIPSSLNDQLDIHLFLSGVLCLTLQGLTVYLMRPPSI